MILVEIQYVYVLQFTGILWTSNSIVRDVLTTSARAEEYNYVLRLYVIFFTWSVFLNSRYYRRDDTRLLKDETFSLFYLGSKSMNGSFIFSY